MLDTESKFPLFFGVRFEKRKVDEKQTCMKTETSKLCSGIFWIFLPYVIRFKDGAFLRHSLVDLWKGVDAVATNCWVDDYYTIGYDTIR